MSKPKKKGRTNPTPRQKVMSPDFLQLAAELSRLDREGSMKHDMCMYDLGSTLVEACQQEAKSGPDFVAQLAEYLGYDPDDGAKFLHALRSIAESFDRELTQAELRKPMANGQPLRLSHFQPLLGIKSKRKRKTFLEAARKQCLSPELFQDFVKQQEAADGKIR